jgi:copper resistance protein B
MKRLRTATAVMMGLAWCTSPLLAAEHADHASTENAHAEHAQPEHDHGGAGTIQPRTPIPVLTDADRVAAMPPSMPHPHTDEAPYSYTLLNRLEAWDDDGRTGLGWEAEGWVGRDINRLWWRSEGERVGGHTGAADLEALFGHGFSSRWDWVAGLRQDLRPRAQRSFLAVGVRGLAPQWFEVSATAYIGEGGRTAARLGIEYSLLITNRLVLQPLLDLNWYGKDDATRGIGAGLGTAEAGLRLRYEFTRRFAPYLGVSRERGFGDTARLRRNESGHAGETRVVAGVRAWF